MVEFFFCIVYGFDFLMLLVIIFDIFICGLGIIGFLWVFLFYFYGYRKVIISEVLERRRGFVSGLNMGY